VCYVAWYSKKIEKNDTLQQIIFFVFLCVFILFHTYKYKNAFFLDHNVSVCGGSTLFCVVIKTKLTLNSTILIKINDQNKTKQNQNQNQNQNKTIKTKVCDHNTKSFYAHFY